VVAVPVRPAARPDALTARQQACAALGRELAERDARALAARRAAAAPALGRARRTGAAGAAPADRAVPDDVGDRPVRLRVPGVADQERLTPPVGHEIIRQAANRIKRFNFTLLALAVPAFGALAAATPAAAGAQEARIRDLTLTDGAAPIRLVGYGLAVGLDNSGDRSAGGRGGMTVQSVVNLLRNFNVEVPADLVRTRNAAAVLVTAEVSPYLRAGGRFDVNVASLGDARSLRGGVLYMTPLVAEAGGRPVAGAQGALLLSDGVDPRQRYGPPAVETAGRVPGGGQLEADLPRPTLAQSGPPAAQGARPGDGHAHRRRRQPGVRRERRHRRGPGRGDPQPPAAGRAAALARVGELAVRPARAARVVIDARDGTVVAGGDLAIGEAVVSHGAVTLNVGDASPGAAGAARAPPARASPATCAWRPARACSAWPPRSTPCRPRPPTSPRSSPPCATWARSPPTWWCGERARGPARRRGRRAVRRRRAVGRRRASDDVPPPRRRPPAHRRVRPAALQGHARHGAAGRGRGRTAAAARRCSPACSTSTWPARPRAAATPARRSRAAWPTRSTAACAPTPARRPRPRP
jgi:flagellar P-ring protein precursor FlgI